MINKALAFAAATLNVAAPCMAASADALSELGERRTGAAAGMYVSVPFGGTQSGRLQAGLRLQMSHDYRSSNAPTAPVIRSSPFDLRLVGDRQATFYVAGMPLNGEGARRNNLTGAGTLVTVAIVAAAAVGALVIYNAIDDDDDDDLVCLLPEGCP